MAELAAPEVIAAASQLMRAAQWNAAADLVRAARTDDAVEQRALASILAEIAVDQDFAQQTDTAGPAFAAVAGALETLPDATTSWDLEMLRLRMAYANELFASDATTHGPDDRDRTTAEALSAHATQLRDQAPDDARRGLTSFYAGVIADNLLGDTEAAFTHFTAALEFGERSGDDLVASLALRHLGDHAHTAGDLKTRPRAMGTVHRAAPEGWTPFGCARSADAPRCPPPRRRRSIRRPRAGHRSQPLARQVNIPLLITQTTDLMS